MDSAPNDCKRLILNRRSAVQYVLAGAGCMLAGGALGGCRGRKSDAAVMYTSSDLPVAKQVLAGYEKLHPGGAQVVTDTEATKTTGLLQRLLQEISSPRCHVWWSNELLATVQLAEAGILTPYTVNAVSGFNNGWPSALRDKNGLWHGHSLRARVILYNPTVMQVERNVTFDAVLNSMVKGKAVMARPQFGTTRSQWAHTVAAIGEQRAAGMMKALKSNEVRLVDGNSGAAQEVVLGSAWCALTDTDDALAAIARNDKLDAQLLTFGSEFAPVLVPNSFALIAGHPVPHPGEKLIQYLLEKQTEESLSNSEGYTVPMRSARVIPLANTKAQAVREKLTADIISASVDFSSSGLAGAIATTDALLNMHFPI